MGAGLGVGAGLGADDGFGADDRFVGFLAGGAGFRPGRTSDVVCDAGLVDGAVPLSAGVSPRARSASVTAAAPARLAHQSDSKLRATPAGCPS